MLSPRRLPSEQGAASNPQPGSAPSPAPPRRPTRLLGGAGSRAPPPLQARVRSTGFGAAENTKGQGSRLDSGTLPAGVQHRQAGTQAREEAFPPAPLGVLILTVGAPILVPHKIAWPRLQALGTDTWRPLWLLGKRGSLRMEGQGRKSNQLGSSLAPRRSSISARPGQRGGSGGALPSQGPPPPGPRVGYASYARHTAPALRSVPPSRGAGAGGPKPSWP